jgi:hypothetical protein
MGMLTKEALLGASDLVEREVDLPSIGGKVRVRSLPAAYSNKAISEALEMVQDARGRQTSRINTERLETLQVQYGLTEPRLNSFEEASTFAQRCGPAFKEVVRVIDEISGVDKEAIEKAAETFPDGGLGTAGVSGSNGSSGGDS